MRVVTISEFATPSAFLCFSIVDAGFRKSSNGHVLETSRNDDDFEVDSEEENDGNDDVEHDALKPYALSQICVDFFLVDPKSVQRCKIVYDDAVPALQGSNGIVKGDIKVDLKHFNPPKIRPKKHYIISGGGHCFPSSSED